MNTTENNKQTSIITSIAPWLSVSDGTKAVDFYKSAFGAVETYRLEDPGGGVVARLSIDGAEFWLSGVASLEENLKSNAPENASIRMILTVGNPDEIFRKALKAGATQVFPVGEEHGWRLGRLADPFGHHWEIGHQVIDN